MSWIVPVASGLLGLGGSMIGGKDAQNSANQELQQQSQEFKAIQAMVNQLMQTATNQYNQFDLPAMSQVFPQLEAAISGKPNTLMSAAQAPVNVQTQRALNQVRQMQGGVTNPNALIQDVAQQGEQNAALAGDRTISDAIGNLVGLIGQGTQFLSNAGTSGESALAGIASQLGQQSQFSQMQAGNAFSGMGSSLASILGSLFKGGGSTAPGAAPFNEIYTGNPGTTSIDTPTMAPMMPTSQAYAPTPSTPISTVGQQSSYTPPPQNWYGG